jgi:DNA-binding response OmpR family regulator
VTPPIVVVDDSRTAVHVLALALRQEGYTVETAEDGETGLALIRAVRPRLAFVDAEMPRVNGYELALAVRDDASLDPQPYLIMLTAGGQEADRERAEKAGVDEFMTKPFSPSQLRGRVRELLGEA